VQSCVLDEVRKISWWMTSGLATSEAAKFA